MHAKYILESVVSPWTSKKAYLSFLWSASEGHVSKAYRMENLSLVSLLCQENLLPFLPPWHSTEGETPWWSSCLGPWIIAHTWNAFLKQGKEGMRSALAEQLEVKCHLKWG